MYIIFGLGNPGKKYEQTRHNAGFMFTEAMAKFLGWDSYFEVGDWEEDDRKLYRYCFASVGGKPKVMMAQPLTFMNASGSAASQLLKKYQVTIADEFVLAHDDLDIPLGKYKMQKGVSPKVHNGVLSIEQVISRREFLRVRLGVDSRMDVQSEPGEEYVLKPMSGDERELLDEAIAEAVKQLRQTLSI